jgi:aldehyde:ferredoxin oxidoreductase
MNNHSFGWVGKILHVDLSTGAKWTEPTEKYSPLFLGGKGINQAILFDQIPCGTKALDEKNVILLGSGPLTGTLAPSSGRITIGSMNVLTGGLLEDNAGGNLAPEIKFAGYDHIVIHGKSPSPVYLFIWDEKVELRDASSLWGKTSWQAEDIIREELGGHFYSVLIGQAGENLVKGAAVVVDRSRIASKGGIGAVFGSKNLKGVVVRGSGSIHVANQEGFLKSVENAWRILHQSPKTRIMHAGGTHLDGTRGANLAGMISTRNSQDAFLDESRIQLIDYPVYHAQYEKRRAACFGCPTYCSHFYQVPQGSKYPPLLEEGFQANTIWGYGGRLDILDPEALIYLHALNSMYGLDQDFTSVVISWAMELFEKGILSQDELDGLDLRWGNVDAVIELLRKITYREGIGDLLAEGVKRASEEIGRGSDYYAVHVKGQDILEELRTAIVWGFGVIVALRGGGHTEGASNSEMDGTSDELAMKLYGVKTLNPYVYSEKEKVISWYERWAQIVDSVGLCYFTGPIIETGNRIGMSEIADLVTNATGIDYDEDKLFFIGQRDINLQKSFNTLHAGFTRKDDLPPKRFLEEAIKTGPHAGVKLDIHQWNELLDRYYQLQGWDVETGWPLKSTLEQFQLDTAAKKLAEVGRLK